MTKQKTPKGNLPYKTYTDPKLENHIFDTTDLDLKIEEYTKKLTETIKEYELRYFGNQLQQLIDYKEERQRLKAEVEKSFERLEERIKNKNLSQNTTRELLMMLNDEKKRLGI